MESDYYLGFSCTPDIGSKTFSKLVTKFQSAKAAWSALYEDYKNAGFTDNFFQKFDTFRKTFDIEKYQQSLKKKNVVFIPQYDETYPTTLLDLEDPPIGLFVKGNIGILSEHLESQSFSESKSQSSIIAVVGTRKMTAYGKAVTEKITSELVSFGSTIISGLALGVDATAHRTTLQNHGKTIAVLGCGVDCCNPAENIFLYRQILEHEGAIISEYPLSQEANKGTFPARNRIIAALSKGVVIPEAAEGSGSLITADYAKQLGRVVFAVPGPITSKQSAGSTWLLKQGASLVTSGQEILEALHIKISEKQIVNIDTLPVSSEEKQILQHLSNEKAGLNSLSKLLKLPPHRLSTFISNLELLGYIENDGNGMFEIK